MLSYSKLNKCHGYSTSQDIKDAHMHFKSLRSGRLKFYNIFQNLLDFRDIFTPNGHVRGLLFHDTYFHFV